MKNKHIGLYFGSFNPIHEGHIHVITTALKTKIDKLYLVVSPQSPFKPLSELAPFKNRLEMARLCIKGHNLEDKVEAVNWEEHMFPSYTAETLRKAVPLLQENDVTIFMGLDNFLTIEKWRESKYILENYDIFIIPRETKDSIKIIDDKIKNLKETVTPNLKGVSYSNPKKLIDISATEIRNKLQNNQMVSNILPYNILDYIRRHHLYGVKVETVDIPTKLVTWLQQEWKRSNHNKYQHLFTEWISNITQSQIDGYMDQMFRQENNVLGIVSTKKK